MPDEPGPEPGGKGAGGLAPARACPESVSVIPDTRECPKWRAPLAKRIPVSWERRQKPEMRFGGPVRLTERDNELEAFDRIFAEAVHGRGAVVLVNGPIGIG